MARDTNLQTYLTDIADAIRERAGINEQLSPYDFASEIDKIDTGLPLDEENGIILNMTVPNGYIIEKGDFLFWSDEISTYIPEGSSDYLSAIALESGFPGSTIQILEGQTI